MTIEEIIFIVKKNKHKKKDAIKLISDFLVISKAQATNIYCKKFEESNKMIYLSGSITNNPKAKEQFNNAQEQWENKGHRVVNPFAMCEQLPIGLPHKVYMSVCMAVLQHCSTLVIINDISNSKGAKTEVEWAIKNYLDVINAT